MLMFYLPMIIFNAMLEAAKQKNEPVSIDEPPTSD
jgi:hypothetical protein